MLAAHTLHVCRDDANEGVTCRIVTDRHCEKDTRLRRGVGVRPLSLLQHLTNKIHEFRLHSHSQKRSHGRHAELHSADIGQASSHAAPVRGMLTQFPVIARQASKHADLAA